jgi:hypothetical protein
MIANIILNPIVVVISLAAFLTVGHAETVKTTDGQLSSGNKLMAAAAKTPKAELLKTNNSSIETDLNVASAKWDDVKDCTYDARAQFFVGLQRLESKVDDQINELTAKRATMNSATDSKAWDFAMKEMEDARSYLKSVGQELRKASAETWSQQKNTVGSAWARTQEAYDKVKSSTTS